MLCGRRRQRLVLLVMVVAAAVLVAGATASARAEEQTRRLWPRGRGEQGPQVEHEAERKARSHSKGKHGKERGQEKTFGLAALSHQHASSHIMWEDPRAKPECRDALRSKQVQQQTKRGWINETSVWAPFGLDTLTQEAIVGHMHCEPADIFMCNFYTTDKAARQLAYVRNLKAASTSTVELLDAWRFCPYGNEDHRTRTSRRQFWAIAFAPLRFSIVRHPITRFLSALGTMHSKFVRRGVMHFAHDHDWFREGDGFADKMLDVLENFAIPRPLDDFHVRARSLRRITQHVFSQMWFLSVQPCEAPPTQLGLTKDRVDIDAVLRVEALDKHMAELRAAPKWAALLPRGTVPHANVEQGRKDSSSSASSDHHANSDVRIPCRLAQRIYEYYRQDFICFDYAMPEECQ